MSASLDIRTVQIAGHAQRIALRMYRPEDVSRRMPIVVYFHGGGFTGGTLEDAETTASYLACEAELVVVSVGYSLAPDYQFPVAVEDGYLATEWAIRQGRSFHADTRRLGIAGNDAGGNIATGLAMMARDRGSFVFLAQALIAPLLDPSMTRLGDAGALDSDTTSRGCAECYRAYLPTIAQRMHPYAAPIESTRLNGLSPVLIASAERDILHVEAELYAAALIAAGVPTEMTRHRNVSHFSLAGHVPVLRDVARFFRRRLAPEYSAIG